MTQKGFDESIKTFFYYMAYSKTLFELLEKNYKKFNQPEFIPYDPISIPHQFSKPQDIEIMGFIASILAWGQRKTIIAKCNELIHRMDHAPYDFVQHHQDKDLKKLLGFKHRTFNDSDLLYFISFFKRHYQLHSSLENAFVPDKKFKEKNVETAINHFNEYFFSMEVYLKRTEKHIASPSKKSACKRINMFLRWMVRKDKKGVDFGLWKKINPSQLVCPCDVHVDRIARDLGLIQRTKTDWHTAVELTENLSLYDPNDPVKYDFALFGMGVEKKMK